MDNLPSGVLTHIASFLSLLDLSVTSEESLAIVVHQCDILDFGEIHKDLAAKLTDDHIRDVLLSVDAANRVKRLRLAGCTNITGAGLEPLRGSLVIEQIDLSLVGDNESPFPGIEHPISCDHVLPILDSIIEQERCALKHLQFPKEWLMERSISSDFHRFILRYNQMWARRQEVVCCSKCSVSVTLLQRWEWVPQRLWERDEDDSDSDDAITLVETWVHDVGGPWIYTEHNESRDGKYCYGTQRYTCLKCFKHYCGNCNINTCRGCFRVYCADCSSMSYCCDDWCYCSKNYCSGCSAQRMDLCHNCNQPSCDENKTPCYSCGVACCECCRFGGCSSFYTCDQCDRSSCTDCSTVVRCAYEHHGDPCGRLFCSGCAKDVFPWADQPCPGCDDFYCDKHEHMVSCNICGDTCCNDCRVERTLEGGGGGGGKRKRYGGTCVGCCNLVVPLLRERIEGLVVSDSARDDIKKRARDDIKKLTDKIEELTSETKELTNESVAG